MEDNGEIDTLIKENVELITTKINELKNIADPLVAHNLLLAVSKTYIKEFLSMQKFNKVLSNYGFYLLTHSITDSQENLDTETYISKNPAVARSIFFNLFDLFLLPGVIDSVQVKPLFEGNIDIRNILGPWVGLLHYAAKYIVFKTNDLEQYVSTVTLLLEYIGRSNDPLMDIETFFLEDYLIYLFVGLTDKVVLIPTLIKAKCAQYALKSIALTDSNPRYQNLLMCMIYNIARHDQGVEVLNDAKTLDIVKNVQNKG